MVNSLSNRSRQSRSRSGKRRGPATWFVASSFYGVVVTQAASTNNLVKLLGFTPIAPPTADISTTPFIGESIVEEIDVKVMISNGSPAGDYLLGAGVYIAEYDTTSGTFSSQQSTLPADGGRDNWIYLDQKYLYLPAASTAPVSPVTFSCKKRGEWVIDEGKALYLSVSNAGISPGITSVAYFCRLKVSRSVV